MKYKFIINIEIKKNSVDNTLAKISSFEDSSLSISATIALNSFDNDVARAVPNSAVKDFGNFIINSFLIKLLW